MVAADAVRVVVVGVAAAFDHIKVDADFEKADGGHNAELDGAGLLRHPPDGGFQVAVGGDGEGEPEVVVGAFAGVVVADAGVPVDEDGAGVEVGGGVGEGHQGGLVAQAAGVKDGADLPDDVLSFEFGQPGQDFAFVNADFGGDGGVGLGDDRKPALDDVEQFAVGEVHSFGGHCGSPAWWAVAARRES